jgi:hypothetical protein
MKATGVDSMRSSLELFPAGVARVLRHEEREAHEVHEDCTQEVSLTSTSVGRGRRLRPTRSGATRKRGLTGTRPAT